MAAELSSAQLRSSASDCPVAAATVHLASPTGTSCTLQKHQPQRCATAPDQPQKAPFCVSSMPQQCAQPPQCPQQAQHPLLVTGTISIYNV